MFPQRHSFNHISGASLEQMLHHHHQLPSPHMPTPTERQQQQRSRWKPSVEVAPNCPRCASTNTKFCYYNNYSLSQPRYFCKGCRRYWTKGGSLRTVPVGGGCRKNRRAKSSSRQSQRCCVSEDRESSPGDDVDVDVHQTNKGTRDIDMALVFAKFLNPKPSTGSTEEFEIESEAANNASSSSYNYLTPEISVETEPQELSWSGIDELERLLVEDGLWSDATLSSSVTWQPPPVKQMQMQLQLHDLDDLEYSMPLNNADQLLPITSASTMSYDTCWSSFDLSTMQVFSSTP